MQDASQRLCEECFAAAGGADEEDITLVEFDVAQAKPWPDALVVVIHGHREHSLGLILAHDILIEPVVELPRRKVLVEKRRAGAAMRDTLGFEDALAHPTHSSQI